MSTSTTRRAIFALCSITLGVSGRVAQDVRARSKAWCPTRAAGSCGVTVGLTNDGTGVAATPDDERGRPVLFDFVESGDLQP